MKIPQANFLLGVFILNNDLLRLKKLIRLLRKFKQHLIEWSQRGTKQSHYNQELSNKKIASCLAVTKKEKYRNNKLISEEVYYLNLSTLLISFSSLFIPTIAAISDIGIIKVKIEI